MEDQQAKEILKVPPTTDRIPSEICQGTISQECDNFKEENSIPGFCVPKKNTNKKRVILDLSTVNKYIQ